MSEMVNNIIAIGSIILYLIIVLIINKFIIKGSKKAFFIEIVTIWVVIFIMNICCVAFNTPFGIGMPTARILDGGVNKFYTSIGYTIHVYNPNNRIRSVDEEDPKEPITTEFEFLNKAYDINW